MPTDAHTIHRRADAESAPYTDADGFTFHLLRIPEDIPMLHRWFQPERASFWLMRDKTEAEVGQVYQNLMDSGHATAYLVWQGGRPVFLAECYDPAHDRIRTFYDVQPGDLGMHIFIGPSDVHIAGYTRAVFFALMRFMFDRLGAARIVVEPDANNTRIHAINRAAGFVYDRNVAFTEKIASLAFCTRQDFELATCATAIA